MALDLAAALSRVELDAPPSVAVDEVPHNRWLTPGICVVHTGDRKFVLKWSSRDRELEADPWAHHCAAGSDDQQHWNYWRREALVYRHELPRLYEPGGIGAAAAVRVSEDARDAVLLLEYVDGTPAEQWSIADYADAAMRLGRAQARFAGAGSALPDHPWLSKRFLREYSTEKPVQWPLLEDDDAWSHPLVQRNFPPQLRAAALRLHRSHERLLAIAESLPRTLCHLDFWTKNLIRRHDGTVVALDWGFAGDGALGEDIGNLVPDAVFDHFVAADAQHDLERAVLDAYVSGLRDAGWSGDRRLVELGMLASAVKYDWLTPVMLAAASSATQQRYGGGEIDADYRFRERGLALLHNATAAERALELAAEVGM